MNQSQLKTRNSDCLLCLSRNIAGLVYRYSRNSGFLTTQMLACVSRAKYRDTFDAPRKIQAHDLASGAKFVANIKSMLDRFIIDTRCEQGQRTQRKRERERRERGRKFLRQPINGPWKFKTGTQENFLSRASDLRGKSILHIFDYSISPGAQLQLNHRFYCNLDRRGSVSIVSDRLLWHSNHDRFTESSCSLAHTTRSRANSWTSLRPPFSFSLSLALSFLFAPNYPLPAEGQAAALHATSSLV